MKWFGDPVPRRKLTGHLIWFGVWLVVVLVAAWLDPSPAGHGTHRQLGLPPCSSVFFFGKPCPGCGLTTSFALILHGQVLEAFGTNWVGPLLFLGWTVSAFLNLYGYLARRPFNSDARPIVVGLTIFIVVFLVYGAVRWILTPPFGPFWPG